MKCDYSKAKNILSKYGQEHLLAFYDELDEDEKSILLEQICNIDFDQITTLYKNSLLPDSNNNEAISPLPYIDKSKLSNEEKLFYENVGIKAIKNNEFAVITLAGGQGTRLRSFRSKRNI